MVFLLLHSDDKCDQIKIILKQKKQGQIPFQEHHNKDL